MNRFRCVILSMLMCILLKRYISMTINSAGAVLIELEFLVAL